LVSGTVVVLVNGEVLANGHGSTIPAQRENALRLAEGLLPLFSSGRRVVVLHGNKPQVGFVLLRSELTSHVLHTIPLDVCGADTQGATGFILSQAFMNVMRRKGLHRQVISVVTQTLVDASPSGERQVKAIGPWFDREKAEQYRQTRGWTIVEEPGRGYRRGVPSLPAKEILEFEGISELVEMGMVVIAGGGGGVPVVENARGEYEGIEAVLDTEQVAVLMALELKANLMLSVIENDDKFILSGLSTEIESQLTLEELDALLKEDKFNSTMVNGKMRAAAEFLHKGGEQVMITTLRKLPGAITKGEGLRIISPNTRIEMGLTIE
jgi:carbamate kinase